MDLASALIVVAAALLVAVGALFSALLLLPVRGDTGERWWGWIAPWAGAALCLALAGLTKTLGLLVAPGLALAALLWTPGAWWRRVGRVIGNLRGLGHGSRPRRPG